MSCRGKFSSSVLPESAALRKWETNFVGRRRITLETQSLELRASYQGIHYRILYFFSGKAAVVLSHGITKEREVPAKEIDRAIQRKKQVQSDFEQYTFQP
jgi:Phage derived protein Gp49-like (DUF891)